MAKGISLHIGINRVDPGHYWANEVETWDGPLEGCEDDARSMQELAKTQGFTTHILLTEEATREKVKEQIADAATQLDAGDYFFLTYSGHGSQVADISGDEAEDGDLPGKKSDRRDETWCLYDAQLLDDELFELWGGFKKGVRILIFSDSCHSGTVAKNIFGDPPPPPKGVGLRVVPRATLAATYKVHKNFYDGLQSPAGERPKIAASVLLISGCQDDELSQEDQLSVPPHGYFTLGVLDAWKSGGFNNYQEFYEIVRASTPGGQNPNLYTFGGDDPDFLKSKPLVIGG